MLARILGLLLCTTAATTTPAADLSINHDRTTISIEGDLVLEDVPLFRALAAAIPKTTHGIVRFDSPGGQAFAGIRIGETIRQRGFVTIVPNHTTCASACAIAWLAGVPRIAGTTSRIGFHGVYESDTGDSSSAGNAVEGAYLGKLGLSEQAIFYITSSGAKEMQWFNGTDAAELGIDLFLGECPPDGGDCTFKSIGANKPPDRPRPAAAPRPVAPQSAGRAVSRSNLIAPVACPNRPADVTCCLSGYVFDSRYRKCQPVSP
jgi:hypothetical protein